MASPARPRFLFFPSCRSRGVFPMIPHGVFVTGTDTGVGKTVIAAALVRAWGGVYWKPVQSGLTEDDDSATVARLANIPADRICPCLYALRAPASPHEAARREGIRIVLDRFSLPRVRSPLVVEGAGGLFVPLNEHHDMIDLMARLGVPVVLVARSGLGTLNHTLLSLMALRDRGLTVWGVVMNGPSNPDNRTTLENRGRVPVKEIPRVACVDAAAIVAFARVLTDGDERKGDGSPSGSAGP
ncbi:MAG: bioCD [Rhodospirillaceae bacterium]|nr:MAG: bioCD [Rhodospirillaceae bacterium]